MKHSQFFNLTKKIENINVVLNSEIAETLNSHPVIVHIKSYPVSTWVDIYKFVLQGSCGWAHLVSSRDEKSVYDYLVQELSSATEPFPHEKMYELLDQQTQLCRINLRKWKDEGKSVEELWELMQESQKTISGKTHLFTKNWQKLTTWRKEENVFALTEKKEDIDNWLHYIEEMSQEIEEAHHLPILSHSEIYRRRYSPCYRIVKEPLVKNL